MAAAETTHPETAIAFTAVEYLQMAGRGGHSLVVSIESRAATGEIVVRAGEPWCATDQQGAGLAAFCRLVGEAAFGPGCVVQVRRPRGPLPVRNLDGPLEGLLIEAARVWDEAHLHSPQLVRQPERPSDPAASSLDALLEEGVNALLAKSFLEASAAFRAAAAIAPEDRVVRANLSRLREMGFGEESLAQTDRTDLQGVELTPIPLRRG